MTVFQKGKFYNLPIVNVVEDEGNAYFQVKANEKEYLIRMFDFQRKDPELRQLKELPTMVKDIHGDNIVFVQNFARMFGKDYNEDKEYPFTVQNQGMTEVEGKFYYYVCDLRGVPFKLTTPQGVYLVPQQRIYCKVKKISPDRLTIQYCSESNNAPAKCITSAEFLTKCNSDLATARRITYLFRNNQIFSSARSLLEKGDNQWIIKAILAVPDYWGSKPCHSAQIQRLVREYIRICLYLLEESKILLSFPESERENYQDWISEKIEKAEILSEVLKMVETDGLQHEIDTILHKIRNSGFIYKPEHKIDILIAIFTIRPDLLEERIDTILDIIEATNWSRRNTDFKKAFCLFMTYYIDVNRDKVNRTALVNDEASNRLLSRMIRALSYLLLMTDESIDLPLYRSLLYHYLSYVRYNNTIGVHRRGILPSETLIEKAFQALMSADSKGMDLNWNSEIKQSEIFAYRMAAHPLTTNMLTTRSLESDTVRFTVNNNKIIIAPSISKESDHNVVPPGMLDWHDIQIYLPNANRYGIAHSAPISKWKEWWRKVEQALFNKESRPAPVRQRKTAPIVGDYVMIRVLEKDNSDPQKPFRYYCRIEDNYYHGEGWIDVYGIGATIGLFRYNPNFDINSFYYEGAPLLFEARINAEVSNDRECPTYMFDAMAGIDEFVKDNCSHGEETDARIIFHDEDKNVYLAITRDGYGVFIPEHTPEITYFLQDTVKVRLTDISNPRKIQADVIGPADGDVNIKEAADNLFFSYCDCKTFQETDEQLAKDALSLSDDQFEPRHIQQMIAILDHKALMQEDRVKAYGYLSIAHILARMTDDENALRYLDRSLRMLAILEDFGKNSRVDADELALISQDNEDFLENYPLLREKLCQIKIVDSIGRQESNQYLWELTNAYPASHLIGKLSRLMLSYNVSEGMLLSDLRNDILEQIKSLLNIRISVPKIYSFGEEGQLKEFKTSIVFPPDNGMKPNLELQTYNILKVIAGMANAYGGTLYLGVMDKGTANGLAEDLAYFNNSKDKYKNYLRNQIRVAMGGSFNASITEEFPEAGDKWIYALKIRPSRNAVGMKVKDKTEFFLREGASTYQYDDEDRLQSVMNERVFSDYGITSSDLAEKTAEPEEADTEAADKSVSAVKVEASKGRITEQIETGHIRHNVVYDWEDGYGVDNRGFLRFNDDNTWSLLDEVKWEDGILTLAISNKECEGSLILVYEDGEVHRVRMGEILKARLSARNKMRADKRPLFICPAKDTDGLLVVYKDTKGQCVMRLDDIHRFDTAKMTEQGEAYPDNNLDEIVVCELIPKEHHDALKPLHNMKMNSNFLTNHYYGGPQRETLSKLGLILPE
ncbi:MAG: ATP-binding protein [Muribaculaceae bacterium]|nr:ATP-binding protein [Muribaculaceae bacterium]